MYRSCTAHGSTNDSFMRYYCPFGAEEAVIVVAHAEDEVTGDGPYLVHYGILKMSLCVRGIGTPSRNVAAF